MKKSTVLRVLIAPGMDESDIRYATGFAATDPFVLVLESSRRHLLVSSLEAARARNSCPTACLHTPADLFPDSPNRPRSIADQILALLRQLRRTEIEVGPWFPLAIARAIEANDVRVSLSTTPAFPTRTIKSPREIALITRSQRAAVAAMRAAISAIRGAEIAPNGTLKSNRRTLTADSVRNLIEQTLLSRGCTAQGTIVAIGPQGARPHDEGSGPLRAHVPIVLDIFPRDKRTGYWGDITRTVARGPADPDLRRLYRTVLAAQKLALSMVRPGVESRAVQRAVEDFFSRAGYETRLAPPGRESGFIHSVGHGIGLEVHESPGLRNQPGRLSAGNVLTVEPGLYLPGLGGVRIEDTVVVTSQGCKILATFPKILEV